MPVIVKGLRVHPENPILFDFIVDTGNSGLSTNDPQLKIESTKLIKYFLASLTIPEDDLWVNLSPYEKNLIIPDQLGQTEMGRDMLAEDYMLKQITASLIYPEKNLGKEFWNRVYAKAQERYGTNEIPVNTFNKVWIVADKAKVYVHENTAFVVASHLKVMLEEDYLALSRHSDPERSEGEESHSITSKIIRSIILPELEKEVNTGKNFANLRQIFHSMILAAWYKKNFKEALLNQVYSNKDKINGVDVADKTVKEKIYNKYLKAYKKGVFNYIKEDIQNGQTIPRKYFSGGEIFKGIFRGDLAEISNPNDRDVRGFKVDGAMVNVAVKTPEAPNPIDAAMVTPTEKEAAVKRNAARNAQRRVLKENTEYIPRGSDFNYKATKRQKYTITSLVLDRKIEPFSQVKLYLIELKRARGLYFMEIRSKSVEDKDEKIQRKKYLGRDELIARRILKGTNSTFRTLHSAFSPTIEGIVEAMVYYINSIYRGKSANIMPSKIDAPAKMPTRPISTTIVQELPPNAAMKAPRKLAAAIFGVSVFFQHYASAQNNSKELAALKAEGEDIQRKTSLKFDSPHVLTPAGTSLLIFEDKERYVYMYRVGPRVRASMKSAPEVRAKLLFPNRFNFPRGELVLKAFDNGNFDLLPSENGSGVLAIYIQKEKKDNASITPTGGIDFNARNMQLDENGQKIDTTFDPAMAAQFRRGDFSGVSPVIIKITPIQNVMPLLGLKETDQRET